jgi:tetratricopeptide (TPR) repeat protein
MAGATEPQAARYGAFISYSHSDARFARRLHRRLEAYRLPRRIATGRPETRRLKPIFRDREELRAAPNLTEVVRKAIAESSHLIVVCSPDAAASEWVGREVRLFRELRGGAPILAALCRGEASEAFHPELRRGASGAAPVTPLAADFRRGGDGARMALLKLVAALADVRLEDLVQRDAQRRIRQVSAVSLASMAGMIGGGLLASEAIRGRAAAEAERGRGEKVVGFLLSDLRDKLKSVGRLDLQDIVNKAELKYFQGQDLAHLPVTELQQRAKLLLDIGQDNERRGDYPAALAQFEEAKRTTASLLKAEPNDPQRIFDHAQSEYWNGFIHWRLGDLVKAEAGYKAYAVLAHRLVQLAPDNTDWQMEPGEADEDLGEFVLRQSGDSDRAEAYFRRARKDFEAVRRRRPGDRDVEREVADSWAWLGAAERSRAAYDEALKDWMTQRGMLLALQASDPRDVETRTDLVSNDLALGRIAAAKGEFALSLAWFQIGHDGALALANNDPEDSYAAREVRVFELFEARTWLMGPKEQRPRSKIIASKIGDCGAEQAKPNNDELATFCRILSIRLLNISGNNSTAVRVLDRASEMATPLAPKLSECWSIDFRRELGIVSR